MRPNCKCVLTLQVLVIIDAKPKDIGLPTEAYVAVEEVHDVSSFCRQVLLKRRSQY